MKKVFVLISLVTLFSVTSSAQVLFNGASTLKSGNWSIGLNPQITTGRSNDLGFFIHGGYGLGSNSDLGMKLGIGWGDTYFGIDYEKSVKLGKPSISLGLGAHHHGNMGLDGTAIMTFPINTLKLSFGLDMDVVFVDNGNGSDVLIPLWLPINLEVFIKQNLAIVIEGDVAITDHAYTTFGGGINFYF